MVRPAFETNGHKTEDKPLPQLVKDLTTDVSALVRKEMELAKAELAEKGKSAGAGAGMFGAAGVLGLQALGALTACLIIALATVMHPALAALATAVLFGVAAGAVAMKGKRRLRSAVPPAPEQAIESVKEDVRWIRGQRN